MMQAETCTVGPHSLVEHFLRAMTRDPHSELIGASFGDYLSAAASHPSSDTDPVNLRWWKKSVHLLTTSKDLEERLAFGFHMIDFRCRGAITESDVVTMIGAIHRSLVYAGLTYP